MADDKGERVPVTEVQRLAAASGTAPDVRWGFNRIQEGYSDGIPRAVFITPHDEPHGIPLIRNAAVIMDLAVRLAREVERLTAERDAWAALALGRGIMVQNSNAVAYGFNKGWHKEASAKEALRALGIDPDTEPGR